MTGSSVLARWQGGRRHGRGPTQLEGAVRRDPPPQLTNSTGHRSDTRRPEDEKLLCRHLMHIEFGQPLAHTMILRMAHLSYGLNRMNMPVKAPVCSLAAYICPMFITQASLSYTDTLHQKQIPALSQLAQMKLLKATYPPRYPVGMDPGPKRSPQPFPWPVVGCHYPGPGQQELQLPSRPIRGGRRSCSQDGWNKTTNCSL